MTGVAAPGVGPRAAVVALLSLILTVAPGCMPRERRQQAARPRRAAPLEGDFADPFVLRATDAYYAFATGARGAHVQVATSRDLVDWTRLDGDALPTLPAWAAAQAGLTWAPAVLARGASYVLYYTTRDAASGFQCVSAGVAADPRGPYVDDSARALVCQVGVDARLCGSIDPSPFVDADGAPYLLWKSDENSVACRTSPRIWSQRLTRDGRQLVGTATALLTRDRPWEGDILEAPSMVRHDGRYYLFFSANWYESSAYGIGYATCSGVAGPCEKASVSSPFLASAGAALGPGGQELFSDGSGQVWMAYHAWTAPVTSYVAGGARSLRLARVDFSAGVPRTVLGR